MFFLSFIKLQLLRHHVCVHSHRRSTATWRQLWVTVLRAILTRRYKSADALVEDLEHWLHHEPIRARRSGVFTRGRKWVRRNPTSMALVASLVALGAVVGVMFWEKESPRPLPGGIAVLP